MLRITASRLTNSAAQTADCSPAMLLSGWVAALIHYAAAGSKVRRRPHKPQEDIATEPHMAHEVLRGCPHLSV